MSSKPPREELEQSIRNLKETEEQYRTLLDTIDEGVILQAASGENLTWNKSAEKIIGIPAKDISGKKRKAWRFIHEDGKEFKNSELPHKKTLQTGKPCKNQIMGVHRTPDDLRWVSLNTSPLFRNKEKNPYAVVISFTDITDLKVEKDTSQYYLDVAGLMFIALNEKGEITLVNKKGYEILESTEKEILGKNWFDLFTPEEKIDEAKAAYQKIITRQMDGPVYVEHDIITRKGVKKIIAFNNTLIKDKDGKVTGSLSSAEDITELKQIETKFRKSESRFRELAELLPEAVFEADVEMNIQYVNQQAFSMFGYSKEDFKEGLNGIEMLVSGDRKRARENFMKRIQGEIFGAIEYRAVKKDGTVFPVLFHASPIIENGSVSGLRGVIIDITNTKMMEQRLVEAQKMESIGTLAGGIAHDFNNILSPIILHSEMTKNDLPEDDPLQVSIKEIYKASIRARDLVRQILTFARRGAEEKIMLNASRVVKDTIKFLRSTIPSTIEIRYENKADQDTILADPIQINQIVMNLCTNAAYAMRKTGGLLEVILDNRDITQEISNLVNLQPGRYLEMRVKDSGTGIPAKIIKKIFEPYFTTKGPGEGTGLGLSIIHGIVKGYGGSIQVDSQKNMGTIFRVYLPVNEGEVSEDYEKKIEIPEGTERILLVDDEKAGLAAMRRTLENLGYKINSIADSKDALETFRKDPNAVDIVITDMTMPGMTGRELINEIKKIKPDLPAILCTGFSDQIDENGIQKYCIDAFIMKPIIRSEIANTIRKVLGIKNK